MELCLHGAALFHLLITIRRPLTEVRSCEEESRCLKSMHWQSLPLTGH